MNFDEFLKKEYDINYYELYLYSIKASLRYRTYYIPKRNGDLRKIEHPTKDLKAYQRILKKEIFSKLPLHDNVFSYRKNISTKDLASYHSNSRYLLRVDFKNFFHSLNSKNIRQLLQKNLDIFDFNLTNDDITLINNIVCKSNRLTIGAPSSPIISNVLLFDFDYSMNNFSKDIKYSRYADDLYFSSNKPDLLQNIIPYIKKCVSNDYINLKINEAKNIFTSKKRNRTITGLVLTSENKVSIGRKKKRYIKSLVYKYINSDIYEEDLLYLKGYLSFVNSVEKSFLESLDKKYGQDIMKRLKTQ